MRVIAWNQWNIKQMEAAEGINREREGLLRMCEVVLYYCSSLFG